MYCWRLKELCTKLVFWKVYTMMNGQKNIKPGTLCVINKHCLVTFSFSFSLSLSLSLFLFLSSVHLSVPLLFTRRYCAEHSAEATELYTQQYLALSILIYGFCRRASTAVVRGRWFGSPKTPQPIDSVPHSLSHYKFTNSYTRKWTTLLYDKQTLVIVSLKGN